MKPELEDQLSEYLSHQKSLDLSGSLRRFQDWTLAHDAEDKERHAEIMGSLKGHSLRIGALEKDADKLEDRADQSGSWQMQKAEADALVARANANWWRDKTMTIMVGLVMLVLGGAGTMLFGFRK